MRKIKKDTKQKFKLLEAAWQWAQESLCRIYNIIINRDVNRRCMQF